ncbi:DUF2690 domain-containing protein [Micromonospora andamanensis]|uniref:DUF2690 domain-containing protein n=1 Tax=Micromonospora andamanensis TaxID=1287068 RepID=A0ABQ4HSU3_9ACTN|nr:DUF2690 domain-containing protein [Micromonospora andamanensis]GIJ08729.1 hypothetical protein Van01_19430 [Micromonospora andamanensis]
MRRLLLISGLVSILALGWSAAPASAQAARDPAVLEAEAVIAAGDGIRLDAVTLANTGCGSSCDNRDPNTFKIYYDGTRYYTCAEDAITPKLSSGYVYRVSSPAGSVELRYSPRCRTAWARTSAGWTAFKVVSRHLNGNHRKTIEGYSEYGGVWTDMVNDANLEASACYWPASGTDWHCTRWY